jgi:hypothetical protein
MEIYNNIYSEEDQLLWELHKIRHKLQIRKKNKTMEDIDGEVLKKLPEWRNERDSI